MSRRAQRRGVKALTAIAAVWLLGCASVATFPYRACLYDKGSARGLFVTGSVVADDANKGLRFRYDDPAFGDHDVAGGRHGYIWVTGDDGQRVIRRQCKAASPFRDFDPSQPGVPAVDRPRDDGRNR